MRSENEVELSMSRNYAFGFVVKILRFINDTADVTIGGPLSRSPKQHKRECLKA